MIITREKKFGYNEFVLAVNGPFFCTQSHFGTKKGLWNNHNPLILLVGSSKRKVGNTQISFGSGSKIRFGVFHLRQQKK
ncbi:MAG: hypothetical protein ACQETR_16150, partial [Thermodesulfobacteriota bacterium]